MQIRNHFRSATCGASFFELIKGGGHVVHHVVAVVAELAGLRLWIAGVVGGDASVARNHEAAQGSVSDGVSDGEGGENGSQADAVGRAELLARCAVGVADEAVVIEFYHRWQI